MKKNQYVTFTATCEGGTALVDLFVQDGSFKGASRDNIRDCDGWEDDAGVAYYQFEITCGAGPCREEIGDAISEERELDIEDGSDPDFAIALFAPEESCDAAMLMLLSRSPLSIEE